MIQWYRVGSIEWGGNYVNYLGWWPSSEHHDGTFNWIGTCYYSLFTPIFPFLFTIFQCINSTDLSVLPNIECVWCGVGIAGSTCFCARGCIRSTSLCTKIEECYNTYKKYDIGVHVRFNALAWVKSSAIRRIGGWLRWNIGISVFCLLLVLIILGVIFINIFVI